HPELRAWNLANEAIAREGALFNIYRGASFTGIDCPMVLLLWPGYGVCRAGLHFGLMKPGSHATRHTHPVADEAVVCWAASSRGYLNEAEVGLQPLDVLLAPCGVQHGGYVPEDATEPYYPGGFASPPQLDLYLRTDFYRDGQFERPPFENLE